MSRKHSLAIGGTRGIGRAFVKAFAGPDHAVSVIGRRPPAEGDLKLSHVAYWTADLADRDKLGAVLGEVVARNGKVDNLLFFQRYRGQGDSWAGELETSLSSTKFVVEKMTDQLTAEGSSIVVVGSLAGTLVSEGQPLSYHVAKAGLVQMVRYYAVQLGRRGIRVNCVTPGLILKEESKEFYLKNQPLMDLIRQITPLGRMVNAEEAARVVAFLCSPEAAMITGQEIVVDGGLGLTLQETLARKVAGLDKPAAAPAATPEKKG